MPHSMLLFNECGQAKGLPTNTSIAYTISKTISMVLKAFRGGGGGSILNGQGRTLLIWKLSFRRLVQ